MVKIIKVFGKPVGMVENDEFIKLVDAKSHFLRVPPAIALDVRSLIDAREYGAKRVRIVERNTGDEYTADIEFIMRRGFGVDRGWGEQIALRLRDWHKTTKQQPSLL